MLDNALLPESAAANYVRLSPATLRTWRAKKQGPSYLKLGGRVLYEQKTLDEWLDSRRVACF